MSQSQQHRISLIETLIPEGMPNLLLVRVHTDTELIGHGETYYAPHAVAAMIHDWMARRLLGQDALTIEAHWRFLYERARSFGARGTELRAISALDLALWDIAGKVCNQPVWQLLGGKVRDRVPVYNSCGGPAYGANPGEAGQGWPGYGDPGKPGRLQDNWSSLHAPGDLAEELLAEGYTAMKLWTFDPAAHRTNGLYISPDEVKEGAAPFFEIRKRVGTKIELMLDEHGFFSSPAALRIEQELRDVKPLWLEDLVRVDCIDTLADFRRKVLTPVAVSEMFVSTEEFRLLLGKRVADYVMIDPTWVGGISQTVRLARLAEAYNLPVLMHDCTGPLTLLAGLHVAVSNASVLYQETVRAHIRTFYKDLIDTPIVVQSGTIAAPAKPGIGTDLNPELFHKQHAGYRLSTSK